MKQSVVSGSEYEGSIIHARSVEDSIRATRRYTEGVITRRTNHPVQGEDFASRKFCKHYEVYPKMEIGWDMPVDNAIDWLWGDTPCINVMFNYDYRVDKATITIKDGPVAVKELAGAIPGFSLTMAEFIAHNGHNR